MSAAWKTDRVLSDRASVLLRTTPQHTRESERQITNAPPRRELPCSPLAAADLDRAIAQIDSARESLST
jgi:hypothetical protein